MPKYPLPLVTLFHPDELTQPAGLGLPRELPYVTRSRTRLQGEVQTFAKEHGLKGKARRVDGGGIVVDYGEQVRRFRGLFIRGDKLIGYLHEPRLVYMPDELQTRRRWRIEFRDKWHYEMGRLAPDIAITLIRQLAGLKFKINALWLNPPWIDDQHAETLRANLVLGPLPENNASEAALTISEKDSRFWIEWK